MSASPLWWRQSIDSIICLLITLYCSYQFAMNWWIVFSFVDHHVSCRVFLNASLYSANNNRYPIKIIYLELNLLNVSNNSKIDKTVTPIGSDAQGRISGDGTFLVPEGKYPFVVSVSLNDEHICGGFIYNYRFIVTAASCVYEYFHLWLYSINFGL